MISAIILDLDGTLVQTEKLKAQAYAIAAQQVQGLAQPDDRAIEAYREIVGAAREVASRHIVDRLDLEEPLRGQMAQLGVSEPWEVLTSLRTKIYDDMVSDPQVIRDNQWLNTVDLLQVARENYCRTGLATMSHKAEALHVLNALDLVAALDVILTREDVERPKPDPEIYFLAAERLEVQPGDCLVLEDSPNGVRAGVAAGMNVIAIATPFTAEGLHSSNVVDHTWVVHRPDDLLEVVSARIAEHNRTGH